MKINNNILYILMGIAMFIWGISWTSAKVLNNYLSYNNLVFLRFSVGVISMLPFLYKRKLNTCNISLYTKINIIIVGFLFYLYNQCFFIATDRGDAGMGAVFVTTTNPIITFIIISILNRKINIKDFFSIFIGIIGGFIILDIFTIGIDLLLIQENSYFIFCSLIWGIMTILMSKGQKDIDSILYIILTYFVASFIGFYFSDISSILYGDIYNLNFFIHFLIVCSAMSIGTSIYIIASYQIGAVKSSTFIFSVPFIAIITAHFILNEIISTNILVGGLISILSIILINKKNNNLF